MQEHFMVKDKQGKFNSVSSDHEGQDTNTNHDLIGTSKS